MNTRFAANGINGRNLLFSAGVAAASNSDNVPVADRAYSKARSKTGTMPPNTLILLDLLDPFARPIIASEEAYFDGAGI